MCYKIFVGLLFLVFSAFSMEVTIEKALTLVKERNSEIKEISWGEDFRRGQLAQAKAGFFPKLESLVILAPMYGIKGDINSYETDWGTWKPYLLLDARLIFPLHTFGKVSNYKDAAKNGIEVAKGETKLKMLEVVLKTKEYYYQYQLAKTMFGVIKSTKKILEEALTKGQQLLDKKRGEIKKQDLLKLKVYYATALEKYELAKKGIVLAKGAVVLQMGYPQTEQVKILDYKLTPVELNLQNLDFYLSMSKENRPEYSMVKHGLAAKRALWKAERSNHYPNLVLGGQLKYRKTDAVDDQSNPFVKDDYNDVFPGVGLGLQWNWDYGTQRAKVKQAHAEYMKIVEKGKYAEVGLPMDIKRRYYELKECQNNMNNFKPAMDAAKEWMLIEVANYAIGINEAKDLLEAVGADAIARYNYYNAVLNFNMAAARLSVAVGKEITKLTY